MKQGRNAESGALFPVALGKCEKTPVLLVLFARRDYASWDFAGNTGETRPEWQVGRAGAPRRGNMQENIGHSYMSDSPDERTPKFY